MAQDGSQPWQGGQGAFSHLMHHPRDPKQTSSYAEVRGTGGEANLQSSSQSTAKTGTWNGPAPKGFGGPGVPARAASHSQASSSQPSTVSLPGGVKLPSIGFGTYKVSSENVIRLALEAGYRHFDCAAKYDNESLVGEGLKDFIAREGRDKLFLTSKVWNDKHRPHLVRQSCEKSIADLGCGHLDLLLVHWPDAWLPGTDQQPDPEVTIEQTWQAMEALVDEGKTRLIGVANFSLPQVEKLLESSRIKPVVNQVELHPLLAQRKLVGTCLRKGVICVAYSPLGHGSSVLFDLPEVKAVAEEVDKTPAQVLLKWNVQRGVAVIPRSQSEQNIRGNIEGLLGWELTPSQKGRLDALDCGRRTVDNEWHDWGDPTLGGASKHTTVLNPAG